MKNKFLFWLIVIALILALIKFMWLRPANEVANGGNKGDKMPPSPVSVFVVKATGLNNTVSATGTILANEEVLLLPETAGKVTGLNIREGVLVQKGDLLVKINDAELQAQLRKFELQLKMTQEHLARQKQLLSVKGISQEEYDATQNQLYVQQAEVEVIKAQIVKTEIRAPFSGVVGLKYISEGTYVNTSSHIAAIEQLDPVKIDFSVPEKYAAELQAGGEITFTVPENNKTYKAKLIAIEPKIDLNTRTIQLRALAANNEHELVPGAFARIQLPLRRIENALMIPTEAIVPVLKGKRVFVYKNGKAQAQMVETGVRTDAQIQIVSGLQVGDTLITGGMMQLKPDSPVKIVK